MIQRARRFGVWRWTATKERWYPHILAVAVACVVFALRVHISESPYTFSAAITFGAIMSLVVGGNLLLSFMRADTPFMREVRKPSNRYPVRTYMKEAFWSGIVLALAGLMGQFMELYGSWYAAIVIGLFVFCAVCFWRLSKFMMTLGL